MSKGNPNGTAEVFEIVPGKDDQLRHVFSLIVKRGYAIRANGEAERLAQTPPLRTTDHYFDRGSPLVTSVEHENETAPFKLATDVVIIGSAYAPTEKPVPELDVVFEFASRRKVLRVIGNRRCEYRWASRPVVTDPEPFRSMPLRYEYAYGGKAERPKKRGRFAYPRNPLGRGFALVNSRAQIGGLPLPNIEDPGDLLRPERIVTGAVERWPEQPLPAGFGWMHRTWYPRCTYAGAIPPFVSAKTALREEALGLVPVGHIGLAQQFRLPGYSARFNQGASVGLSFSRLEGNERGRLVHMTADTVFEFKLPAEKPRLTLDLGAGEQPLEPHLDLVTIQPDERRMDLIWRGSLEYPGPDWLPEMKHLTARVE